MLFQTILLKQKCKQNVILAFVRLRAKPFLSPIFTNNQLQRQSLYESIHTSAALPLSAVKWQTHKYKQEAEMC